MKPMFEIPFDSRYRNKVIVIFAILSKGGGCLFKPYELDAPGYPICPQDNRNDRQCDLIAVSFVFSSRHSLCRLKLYKRYEIWRISFWFGRFSFPPPIFLSTSSRSKFISSVAGQQLTYSLLNLHYQINMTITVRF